jgi:hypothetical protein
MNIEKLRELFDQSMNQIEDSLDTMRTLSLISGDTNFAKFADLVEIVQTIMANNHQDEFMKFIMPFISQKAAEEQAAEMDGLDDMKISAVDELIKGLDDPGKMN